MCNQRYLNTLSDWKCNKVAIVSLDLAGTNTFATAHTTCECLPLQSKLQISSHTSRKGQGMFKQIYTKPELPKWMCKLSKSGVNKVSLTFRMTTCAEMVGPALSWTWRIHHLWGWSAPYRFTSMWTSYLISHWIIHIVLKRNWNQIRFYVTLLCLMKIACSSNFSELKYNRVTRTRRRTRTMKERNTFLWINTLQLPSTVVSLNDLIMDCIRFECKTSCLFTSKSTCVLWNDR